MGEHTIDSVNPSTIGALLKELGWPASLNGTRDAPQIVSAVNGINFSISFGTKASARGNWTDFTISAPFSIDQRISPVIGAFWNRRNRFARVYRADTQLFLDMDVVVCGGVDQGHLKYQFALWSDLAGMFVRHLRADQALLAHYDAMASDASARPAEETKTNGDGSIPGKRSRTRRQSAAERRKRARDGAREGQRDKEGAKPA